MKDKEKLEGSMAAGYTQAVFFWLHDWFCRNRRPFLAAIISGFAAHAFMLTNKIPFDDDLPFMFDKGATSISGRYGLELMRFIMPDISMPWVYGILTLLLLAAAACLTLRIFNIRNPLLQILLPAVLVSFPSVTGTLSYMFTAGPYALALVMSIGGVYIFSSGKKGRWLISPLLIAFSCSIYQGYFSFASSYCVLLMIKALLNNEKSAKDTLVYGLKLLAMLLVGLAVYGLAIVFFSKLLDLPLLSEVINEKQSFPMRIAVAYSAYLNTVFKGYFGFVNSGLSRLMHIILLLVLVAAILLRISRCGNLMSKLLLGLCLFLFPLSCYCLYMLADNGYIHAMALYSFSSLYILAAIVLDGLPTGRRHVALKDAAAIALMLVLANNVYFSNSFYLYTHLQYETVYSTYTSVLAQLTQTPGFDEDVSIAIIGDAPALREDYDGAFDFSKFILPGNNIIKPVQAPWVFRYYLGCDVPFADDARCAEIMESAEFAAMPVYPYEGSVKLIGDVIAVKFQ